MAQRAHATANVVKAQLYWYAQRYVSPATRKKIREWLDSNRRKWPNLYLLVNGRFDAKALAGEIARRIGNDFEILMVHSSYDSLFPMYTGTLRELLQELVILCGADRTLAMPSFVLGRRYGGPIEFYKRNRFDVRRTPSEMGALSELFRRFPLVRRSMHPTHSVCALGPLAGPLTDTHHTAPTPSGRGTPFELMMQRKTTILGLGVEYYRCLTQVHTAEDLSGEIFPVRFRQERIPVRVVAPEGYEFIYDHTVFTPPSPVNFGVLRSLLSPEELQEWTFKGVPLFVTRADVVTTRLVAAARKGISLYLSN